MVPTLTNDMKREHLEAILWTFMIVVLILLAVRIDNRGETMDCNQCTVTFQNKMAGGEYFDFGEYKIKELYDELYFDGTCALSWNPTQGYSVSHNAPQ